MGRRGISPLIATILLIAFAVALGSLVYSYIVIFSGGTGQRGCSGYVSIDSAVKVDGAPAYQLQDSEIKLDIRNTGYTEVSSIVVTIVGTENTQEIEEPSRIAVGRTDSSFIGYSRGDIGTINSVIVTPYYVQTEEEVICSEAALELTTQKR